MYLTQWTKNTTQKGITTIQYISGIKRNNHKQSLPRTIQRTPRMSAKPNYKKDAEWAFRVLGRRMNRLPTQKRSKFLNSLLNEASKTSFQSTPTRYELSRIGLETFVVVGVNRRRKFQTVHQRHITLSRQIKS